MIRLGFLAIVAFVSVLGATESFAEPDTLPPIEKAPSSYTELWAGFDPRAEPLETEVLGQWEEDGVVLRVVRFRIGVFKGQKATLAGVYGHPKDGTRLPGLLQIHGGGQYADAKACLLNAKRGYATLSIAWAGRISSSKYRLGPNEVKLFWEGDRDNPNYRATTDWGAVDGYHAPSRNPGNVFPSAKAAPWTIDEIESARNSGWFLCALAARRALTFLEQQPEVDRDRLGVYGHSMGGKLTVMTAPDPRVKVAAPSCGGISDRYNESEIFRAGLGDDVSLKEITCPIIFLSPANDFHGRLGDLPKAIAEIQSSQWRVTCSPHHNHQDTAEYEAATMVWFDHYLKGSGAIPQAPELTIRFEQQAGLEPAVATPVATIKIDDRLPIESVDLFYSQDGKDNEQPSDRDDVVHRFWHHASATLQDGRWQGSLPDVASDRPLWVYANVVYELSEPVSGAGYYYRPYVTDTFNLSSLLVSISPDALEKAKVQPSIAATRLIDDFEGDWRKEWFSYRPDDWALTTNKPNTIPFRAGDADALVLETRSEQANAFVVVSGDFAAEVQLVGGNEWQRVKLSADDFRNIDDEPLGDLESVRQVKFCASHRLRSKGGGRNETKLVGGQWNGPPPEYRQLRWE